MLPFSFNDAFKNAEMWKRKKDAKKLEKQVAAGLVEPALLIDNTPLTRDEMDAEIVAEAQALQIATLLNVLFQMTGDERFDDASTALVGNRYL